MSESKYRITDLAKEFKTDKDTIIDILKSKNYKVKNMFSAVGEEERAAVRAELGRTAKPVRKESLQSKSPAPKAAARPAKKEKRAAESAVAEKPVAEKPAAEKSAPETPAESTAPAAPPAVEEKPVLRARTKAPGIVIVRQAPAKTRAAAQAMPADVLRVPQVDAAVHVRGLLRQQFHRRPRAKGAVRAVAAAADAAARITPQAETAAAMRVGARAVTARSARICVRQSAAAAVHARAARDVQQHPHPQRRLRSHVRSTSSCRRRSPSRISRPR